MIQYDKNKDLPDILTVEEVAEILRVHRTTVSKMARSGELPSYRIGSRRLFKREEIFMFFDNQIDKLHAAHDCHHQED